MTGNWKRPGRKPPNDRQRSRAGKTETGERKQLDRAGCPLFEANTRRADGVLKRPGKPFYRFGSKWPEAGSIHKGGQRP